MRKLLWIGDAGVATGFAKCTHQTLEVLRRTWEIHVLALNYQGDPHPWPYSLYPCWPGGDLFGVQRVSGLVKKIQPDLVVIQNDPWNIPEYLKKIDKKIPVVASMPVDGKNCQGQILNDLDLAIFWTQFGLSEARKGGFTGKAEIIPLGVDLDLYKPMDRIEARKIVGLPGLEDAFIVGNVNRNQPRKRLDLTIQYFAEWIHSSGIDAYLFLLIAPTGELGYDVRQLMKYYGFGNDRKKLILSEPHIGNGLDEKTLPAIYNSFDVQISTTQGEGWGLTTMEGMACGIPQIVPRWAALGEWCEDAVHLVDCDNQIVTPNHINAIGGLPNRKEFIEALQNMYVSRSWSDNTKGGWAWYSERGRELVRRPEYNWKNIGLRFEAVLEESYEQKKKKVA